MNVGFPKYGANGKPWRCAGIHGSSNPELKPTKITDDEDKNKSRIELLLPEPLLIAYKKMKIYSSAPLLPIALLYGVLNKIQQKAKN